MVKHTIPPPQGQDQPGPSSEPEADPTVEALRVKYLEFFPNGHQHATPEVFEAVLSQLTVQSTAEDWNLIITAKYNAIYNGEIDRVVPRGPAQEQLRHMITMAGLSLGDWQMLVSTVVVPDSIDFQNKCKMIVQASRCQDFDPLVIARKFVISHRAAKSAPYEEHIIKFKEADGEEKEWKYHSREDIADDSHFLVLVFLNRRAIVHKLIKKSNRDFVKIVKMLCAKYQISAEASRKKKDRNESLDPEVMTFPRIAAVFAQMTVTLHHRDFIRNIANIDEFQPGVVKLPKAFFSPMFPSVVSRLVRSGPNNKIQNIHPQLVLLAILVDNVLHQQGSVTDLGMIWTYYKASFSSPVINAKQRHELCKHFGVVDENDQFAAVITGQRQRCIERIRELRSHGRINEYLQAMEVLE